MDRARAIAELPMAYAVALRLRDAAADQETIARALDIDPEGVPGVLRIGEAKLAALLDRHRVHASERFGLAD
jgi:hypothetical protein